MWKCLCLNWMRENQTSEKIFSSSSVNDSDGAGLCFWFQHFQKTENCADNGLSLLLGVSQDPSWTEQHPKRQYGPHMSRRRLYCSIRLLNLTTTHIIGRYRIAWTSVLKKLMFVGHPTEQYERLLNWVLLSLVHEVEQFNHCRFFLK